jgi:glycosyltransferase involved in cell wall biosynthesis
MAPQPRVALLLPSLDGGGAQRVLLTLAEQLPRHGVDTELVVGERRGALAATLPAHVRVVDLGQRRLRSALLPLVRYLRASRPACLLATLNHANVLALVAARLAGTGTPVVVRVANRLTYTEHSRPSRVRPVVLGLAKLLYRRADLVVAVSNAVAEDLTTLMGVPGDLVQVIPNPVVPPDLPALTAAPTPHPWLQQGQAGPPIVLGIGRLTSDKGFDDLLRAFSTVRQGRHVRLIILGEGSERSQLERLASDLGVADDVDLPGFVTNPYPYLAQAAVFVLSSHREGLPGALIQALASGAPVVATDCPSGPREILQAGRLGPLVPPGDVSALADAVSAVLDEPGERAPVEAYLPYTVDHAVRSYAAVLRRQFGELHPDDSSLGDLRRG